jgi:hypothetical protein
VTYEVLVEELRAAAKKHRDVAGDIGDKADVDKPDAAVLGHVELAGWLVAVIDQCDKASAELHDVAGALADGLEDAALSYEGSDWWSAQQFSFNQPTTLPFLLSPDGGPR